MRSIGIRELRQHASRYLKLVKEGETLEITERGEPIAMITPVPREESVLDRLRREGRIVGPEEPGSLLDIEPLPADPDKPSLSQILNEMRADER